MTTVPSGRERCDLLVFRESAGRARYPSATLVHELQELLDHISLTQREPRHELLTNALLRAGEIECALADRSHPATEKAEALTDAIARATVSGGSDLAAAAAHLRVIDLPATLTVTAPEGFAYYALDPLRYANTVRRFHDRETFVVGIRSIGTVLSAICAAALQCERLTVRPTGHPYDRELTLNPGDGARMQACIDRNAQFVIVDEGPGLSGSSFLATAEALEREGVARERITLVGSHTCDGSDLVAHDAAARWQRFQFVWVPSSAPPADSRPFLDWDWRRESSLPVDTWPAGWSQLTPPKYVSADGKIFWKFEGLGRAGDQVRARAHALAAARFAPDVIAGTQGFTGYQYVRGTPLSLARWNAQVAQRIAEYLAFRKTEFAAAADSHPLAEMARHNTQALLERGLHDLKLDVVRPCICDSRMMPHEWIQTGDGRIFKMDATMHGDDHFFPGPCDIAWDVAAIVIEWSLDARAEARFLAIYEGLTADHVRQRLPQYKIAYSAFRAAFARMAAGTMSGTAEAVRFDRDLSRYVEVLRREVQPLLRAKKEYSVA